MSKTKRPKAVYVTDMGNCGANSRYRMQRPPNKLTVHFSENIEPPLRTTLKQVILAGGKGFLEEVSISFVSPQEIQRLNYQYRKKDTPTDVLSFPGKCGDIIICKEVARTQAEQYGHSMERELAFLTAHGLLHLMGYNHQDQKDEAEMIQAQKEILQKVGIAR